MSSNETIINCRNINVSYPFEEYKTQSIKETIIRRLKGQHKSDLFDALKNINIEIRQGETIGLIGHNGCGKSTFLKVLAGVIQPVSGQITVKGRVTPLIELGAGFDPELTGIENIYLNLGIQGHSKNEIRELISWITDFSELGSKLDMPIKTYSSGMYMRLGFACAVAVPSQILLIDEIMAVGDENFQKKCFDRMKYIREKGVTMILVSHDMNQIRQMAERVIVFDEGIKSFDGDPTQAINHYSELMDYKRIYALPEKEKQEELRKKELQKNDSHQDFGSKASINKASVKAVQGSKLISGHACKIDIDFEIKQLLSDLPVIGFAIYTHSDIRLTGGNSTLINKEHAYDFKYPGKYRFQFDINELPLAPGKYRLVIAIHNQSLTKTLDINGAADEFIVVSSLDEVNPNGDLLSLNHLIKNGSVGSISVS